MIEIEVELPVGMRLDFDRDKVLATAGRQHARAIRQRIRNREGLRPGQTLRKTGRLIRSIKYDDENGVILPTGRRPDGSRRVRTNFALMLVHISGKYRREGYQRLEFTDPMGFKDPKMRKKLVRAIQDALNKEIPPGRITMRGTRRAA